MTLPPQIPIFPLPDVVFYPRTDLPLHVFEPRYRQMVSESLPGDRILGVVLLKDGWQEDYFGSPDTHRVGCAGRMEDVVTLPDGRFTLKLEALEKIEILRFARLEPYRVADVRAVEEREPSDADALKRRLMGAYTSLAAAVAGRPVGPMTVDGSVDCAALVNLACMHVGIEAEEKQRLLELCDVSERGHRIVRRMERELERLLSERAGSGGSEEESVH